MNEPSIEALEAIWHSYNAEQFRTWHEAAMRAAWEAGRAAAIEGAQNWYVVQHKGDAETPACLCGDNENTTLFPTEGIALDYLGELCDENGFKWSNYEVRPARLIVGEKT